MKWIVTNVQDAAFSFLLEGSSSPPSSTLIDLFILEGLAENQLSRVPFLLLEAFFLR